MTVSTTIRKAGPFAGTGLVSSYPFAFKVFTDDDLLVIRTPTGGADVTLVLASDYTVTLNPDQDAVPGGSVVLSAPLAVGYTLSIGSQVDSLQGLSLTNNGGFFPKAIENALDKLDIQDQQQEETLSRAVRVPFGSGAIPDLPTPSAGSALVWNTTGTALENGAPGANYDTLRSDLAGTGSGQGAGLVGASVATDYADNTLGFLVVKNTGTAYNALRGFSKANQALIQNYGYGVDTTAQLLAMLADSGIQELYLPHGGWLITANISIPNFKHLKGAGYGLSAGQAPTRILKRGAFNGVYVNAGSQLSNLSVEGDTGNTLDGVTLVSGRSRIANVSSFAHGQDGFKIGPYTAGGNANLWDLRGLISRSNTRHGMLIEHTGETTLPNANAGILMGFEASFNGGDGLKLGSTIDNQLYGVVCQQNTGYGVHYAQYAKGNYMPMAYTEANTAGDTVYDSGADLNFFVGFRSGLVNDGVVNNGANNMVVGRQGSIEGIPLHRAAEAFFNLRIFDGNASPTSGQWAFTKENTTRHLRADLTSTSSSADLMIGNTGGGAAGLRFGTSTNDGAIRGFKNRIGTTLNFGLIAANSSTDVTVTVSGADNTWSFLVSPTHAIPVGVSWCAYWDSGASAVKVRCLNGTAAGVTVNGAFILTAFKNA